MIQSSIHEIAETSRGVVTYIDSCTSGFIPAAAHKYKYPYLSKKHCDYKLQPSSVPSTLKIEISAAKNDQHCSEECAFQMEALRIWACKATKKTDLYRLPAKLLSTPA
ncbi:hypothetical protein VNO80_17461 [Phaseolus coccineus]|uniref:Uncharacterized protein n=1 Tax=Phaseolus coccineus TaxID=3886 RepID=A0AAN9MCB8_PHACN